MLLAPFYRRAMAAVIDIFLVGIVGMLPASALLLTGLTLQSFLAFAIFGLFSYLAVGLTIFLYGLVTLQSNGHRNGQSLGKQIMDIRVIKTNLTPFSKKDIFIREVLLKFGLFFFVALITYTLLSWINYLWPLGSPKNQSLHDKITKTLVVEANLGTSEHIEISLKNKTLQTAQPLFDIQHNGVLEQYLLQSEKEKTKVGKNKNPKKNKPKKLQ